MPIYEYKCEKGHTFEVIQPMSDDPVEACEVCGAPVERVFHPVAVHFKGSGFYSTDYAGKGKDGAGADGGSSRAAEDGAHSKKEKSDAKTTDAKNARGSGDSGKPGGEKKAKASSGSGEG